MCYVLHYTPHRFTWLRYSFHHICVLKTSDQLIIHMAQAPRCHSHTVFTDITTDEVHAFLTAHASNTNFQETVKSLSTAISDGVSDLSAARFTTPLIQTLFPQVQPDSTVTNRMKQIAAVAYIGPKPPQNPRAYITAVLDGKSYTVEFFLSRSTAAAPRTLSCPRVGPLTK